MQGNGSTRTPERRPTMGLVLVVALVAVMVGLVAVIDSSDPTEVIATRGSGSESLGTIPPSSLPTSSSSAATPPTTGAPPATTATTRAVPTTTGAMAASPKGLLPTPTTEAPLRLWVGGDSLAAGPSWAVFVAARDTGVIKPLAEYQVGTGLVRSEFWDWPKHMDAVVRARDPQVSVFMVGANDDQGIEVDGASYKPPDPRWVAEYRRRVDQLIAALTTGGRRLLLIGMPPMRDAEYSASMGLLDEIMQEEANKRRRVAYIDAWTLFSAPGAVGTYAQFVPDESGQLVNMRLDDGIHLNVEGSHHLARAVMAELGKIVTLPSS
jgi:uncharacterized protein